MTARMERVLTKLAQRHAQYLMQNLPDDNTRIQKLADGLARHGVLVLAADMPRDNADGLVNKWISTYGSLYSTLTDRLFPSYTDLSATYADNQHPPVVVLKGQSIPVVETFGGYIAPYVALKQHDKLLSEAELRGVLTIILDALEANDIDRASYNRMLENGAEIMHEMLQLPIKHIAITSFARPLFTQLQQQGTPPPQRPPTIPEPPPEEPMTETGKMFSVRINPLAGRKPRKNGHKPPVRRPPGMRDDDDDD